MESYLKLQLEICYSTQNSPGDSYPKLSKWNIPHGETRIYNLKDGELLLRTFSTYLVNTEVFEFKTLKEEHFKFKKDESVSIMYMMLEGRAQLFDHSNQLITEIIAPCYFLIYIPKGNYTLKLDPGLNKLLIFTSRPEWLIKNTKKLEKFAEINENLLHKSTSVFSLPHCTLNKTEINRLINLISKTRKDNTTEYSDINSFALALFLSYNTKLTFNRFNAMTIHKAHSNALINYVEQHFKEPEGCNIPLIARKLAINADKLSKLSIACFGMPLSKHFINLRLAFAKELLINTSNSIKEIAFMSGHTDAQYFSKKFKDKHGQSPLKFRQSL